ncbi:MAG: alpha/beta hydrolase [Pseudomonadales bacterium]
MKNLSSLILISSTLLFGCAPPAERENMALPNYHLLSSCEKPEDDAYANLIEESLCGTISVFEDRDDRTGRKIDLNIMLLPATTSAVKPDPIFFLAGGPGQSAVETGPALFTVLRKLRKERDIVLVDQRGTGQSSSLACELDIPVLEQLSLSIEEITVLHTAQLKKCLTEFDANPALYTTPIAMDDLNEVREVLGYDKINLLGISYGTRAGLVYLRRHEDTVRSIVLDAVAPTTMVIPKNVAVDAQSAFEQMLADCQSQPGCKQAFPDLHAHFREVVERLQTVAETVTIRHPRTGVAIRGTVDPLLISRLTRGVLYSRTLSQLLPLVIEEAYKGNYQPLSTLSYSMSGEDSQLSTGMMLSVLCAEDMTLLDSPYNTEDFDNPLFNMLSGACEFWPRGSIPEDYFNAVSSMVPVLLTSGILDPITPPKYAWEAAATLGNSEHVIVPGVGHGSVVAGCMPEVVATFFDNPKPKEINASCSVNLRRLLFFTSYAGAVTKPDNAEPAND